MISISTMFDRRTKSYIKTINTYDLDHTPPLKLQEIELWTEQEEKEAPEKKTDG